MKCEPFTYSLAQAADYSPISSSDTRQLPLLSGTDTAAKSCASELQRDGSQICTCTKEIFGCSIHPNTRDEWIASAQVSLARTLARPEIAQALRKVRAAVSGPKSSALLASFDLVTCSLKTSQQSLVSDSTSCSPILPSWGLMQGGAVYELPMLERLISGIDGGAWPTPTVGDVRASVASVTQGVAKHHLNAYAAMWPTPSVKNFEQVDLDKLLARRERVKAKGINGNGFGLTLGNAARMWPTPNAAEAKQSTNIANAERRRVLHAANGVNMQTTLTVAAGGGLNPIWVEWLMAWPLGWTVSTLSGMGKSQRKQRSHGES